MRRLVLLPALLAFLVGAVPALAWTWPVDGPVLQSFAFARGEYAAGQHRGIDVGADVGTPVRAPVAGMVSFAGTVPAGGLSITIQTSDGLAVTLLHLGTVVAAEGDVVAEGDHVGAVGWSGDAEHEVPSVHLGVRVVAETAGYLDPLRFLSSPLPEAPLLEDDRGAPVETPAAQEAAEASVAPPGDGATPLPQDEGPPPSSADAAIATAEPAGVIDAGLAQLEPLAVAAPEPSAPPPHVAPPVPSGRVPDASPSRTGGAAASSASTDTPRLAEPALPVETRSPHAQRDHVRDEQRRARRSRSRAGTNAAVIAVPSVPAAHHARRYRGAGTVDGGMISSKGDPERVEPLAAPVRASGGGEWLWRAPLAAIIATSVLAILARRRGGGSARTGADASPSVPPVVTTRAAGAASGPLATPAAPRGPRLAASRPGRRLDRGGPGTPARRSLQSVRRRRASV